MDEQGRAALVGAVADYGVVERYLAKIVTVPDSGCLWWTGAVSGHSSHGRFWYGRGRVIIAHRFGFALVHGVDALAETAVVGHSCDNPLCQPIGPGHVIASSHGQNRREWAARRHLAGSPLADPRGPRRRAIELRDLAREDPAKVAEDLDRVRRELGGATHPVVRTVAHGRVGVLMRGSGAVRLVV